MDQMDLSKHVHSNSGPVLRQHRSHGRVGGLTGCQASPVKTPTATPIDEQASHLCSDWWSSWRQHNDWHNVCMWEGTLEKLRADHSTGRTLYVSGEETC